jgi:predicted GTPase
MGYAAAQVAELEATINAVPCDVVLAGTPIDLRRCLRLRHPVLRVRYTVEPVGPLTFDEVLADL